MIVVADTTPLRYLVYIGEEHVLPKLYDTVYVPPEVLAELGRSKSPQLEPVRSWASSPPEWIRVGEPKAIEERLLQRLDRGEAEAIALAEELKADRILIDEDRGRKMVSQLAEEKKVRGEEPTLRADTTLAILTVAAERGHIDIEKVVDKLRLTNFRATEELYQQTIENVRVRKQDQVMEHLSPTQEHATEEKPSAQKDTTPEQSTDLPEVYLLSSGEEELSPDDQEISENLEQEPDNDKNFGRGR